MIEINHIKAKLTYLSIELIEPKSDSATEGIAPKPAAAKNLMAKINKIKSKKCKFDHNLKSFCKPIDFDLVDEHFLNVADEAANLQMRKLLKSTPSCENNGTTVDALDEKKLADNEQKKTFLFLFSIEVHSYLPVSRKILSSTFRKKKRIFKGQCQIHENFIYSTQFNKQFILTEI